MARVLMQDAFVNNLIPNIADGVRQGLIPRAPPGPQAAAPGPQAAGPRPQAPPQRQNAMHNAGLGNRQPMFGPRPRPPQMGGPG